MINRLNLKDIIKIRKGSVINVICVLVTSLMITILALMNIGVYPTIIRVLLTCILSMIFVLFTIRFIMDVSISLSDGRKTRASLYFIMCFLILMIPFFAYYPGGFNLDALGQWDQAHYGYLNDWHPVILTLFIRCIINIYDSLAFFIFVQLLIFSSSITYLCYSMAKNGLDQRVILVILVYLSINPSTWNTMPCLFKDASFASVCIIAFTHIMNIYYSNGEWMKKPINMAFFTINILLVSLVRHNGIFLSLSMLMVLFIFQSRIRLRMFVIGTISVFCIGLFKGPIFDKLNVYHHSNVVGESVGIAMGILGNEITNYPETIDDETYEFLTSLYSINEWKESYITGEWDSIKWNKGEESINLLSDSNLAYIIELTLNSVVRNPKSAFESISDNTRVITQVLGEAYWVDEPYIEENEYGITPHYSWITDVANDYIYITESKWIAPIFWNIGLYMIIHIILTCRSILKKEYKKLIFTVPIFIYNYGTMCMLSGPSYRYFYFNVPIFGMIVLCMLSKNSEFCSTKKRKEI